MEKYLSLKSQIKEIWAENRVELWGLGLGTLEVSAVSLIVSSAPFW